VPLFCRPFPVKGLCPKDDGQIQPGHLNQMARLMATEGLSSLAHREQPGFLGIGCLAAHCYPCPLLQMGTPGTASVRQKTEPIRHKSCPALYCPGPRLGLGT
jgi:hypothetical protein